jgi:hypothetical protein
MVYNSLGRFLYLKNDVYTQYAIHVCSIVMQVFTVDMFDYVNNSVVL